MIRWIPLLAGLLGLGLGASPGHAQVADTTQVPVDSVVVTPGARPTVIPAANDTVLPLSPRGAFIRSMVVPGWGQARFGHYLRGGVYFLGWAANGYMVTRTQLRLGDARDRFDDRVAALEQEIIQAAPDPDSMRAVLESDPTVLQDSIRADEGPGGANDLRKLVRAREQQREDWIAWSIFWILASGVDGYVTAHLADFPAAVEVRPRGERRLSVGLKFPLPGPP